MTQLSCRSLQYVHTNDNSVTDTDSAGNDQHVVPYQRRSSLLKEKFTQMKSMYTICKGSLKRVTEGNMTVFHVFLVEGSILCICAFRAFQSYFG